MLYTAKYAPKKLSEVVGNNEKVDYIRQWMLQWLSGKRRKPLLLWGPSGVGKTSVALALSAEFDLDLIEMNASELRNRERVERILGGASLAGSLFGRGKLVLIDDIDVLAGRADYGGAGAISSFLKESPVPAIVTAADIWDKKLSGIRTECEGVELKRIHKATVHGLLERVAKAEKLPIAKEQLDAIAENARGDARAALNDLQGMLPTVRARESDIFEMVRGVLKAESYAAAREAIRGELDYDFLKLWIDENIPYEYESAKDIAAAYNSLSMADVFDGRIKKTNWQLMKYSIDLATAGVAIAKEKPYRKFVKYNFPGYLRAMSITVQKRAMLKSIGTKVGRHVHASARDSLEYLPLLRALGPKHAEALMAFYDFSEDEVAYILETSVSRVSKKAD